MIDPAAPVNPYAGMLPDWTDEHEQLYQQWAAMQPQVEQFALPGELAKGTQTAPPAPPPLKLDQGLPSYDEVANSGAPIANDNVLAPVGAPVSPTTEPASAPLSAPSSVGAPQLRLVQPDAVSSVGPVVPEHGGQASPGATDAAQLGKDLGMVDQFGRPNDDHLTQRELNNKAAGESDQAFATRQFDAAQHQADFIRGESARLARQFAEDNERDYRDYLDARDAARVEAERLANEGKALANATIDQNHWWASRNTGQKIAGVVAAVVGGLVAPYQGGRNDGLAMIQHAIDQDVEIQKEQLQNRRQALGESRIVLNERMQRIHDDFAQEQRHRIGSYERAINTLQTEALNLDPRGSQAIAYGELIRGLRARQAQAIRATEQAALKNKLAIAKANREAYEAEQKAKKDQAEISQGWARITNDKTKAIRDDKTENRRLDIEASKLDKEGNKEDAKLLREQGVSAPMKLRFNEKGEPEIDPNASGYIKNADNTPWVLPTQPEAVEFRAQKESADMLVSMIDEVREILDKSGRFKTSSEWLNSPEHQRLKVLGKKITIVAKKGTQGMSSDEDMKNLAGAAGADNLTSFRDQASKLLEARELIPRQLKAAAVNRGFHGDLTQFDYPDPIANRAEPTPEEKDLSDMINYDPKRNAMVDVAADLGIDTQRFAGSQLAGEINRRLDEEGGVMPGIKKRVLALRDKLNDPKSTPDEVAFAASALEKLASSAEDENLRAFVLANAMASPAPSPEAAR